MLVRKQWWRANRSKAPARFDEELAAALAAIIERPASFPIFSARGGQTVRRGISEGTVEFQLEVIFDKVGVDNRATLIAKVLEP